MANKKENAYLRAIQGSLHASKLGVGEATVYRILAVAKE
jgi:hypothetical protein